MKKYIFCVQNIKVFIILILFVFSVQSQTRTINGQVINQTVSWSGEIRITGDVVVASTGILIIEQGTKIIFEAQKDGKKSGEDPTRSELIVKGVLLAKGTANNKIVFTSSSKSPRMGDWYGIQIASSRQGSEIEYAIIEYAYDGVTVKKCDPTISNSHIRYNYNSGITVEIKANPRLIANVISENGYAGIVCRLNANPYLSENMIALNQIGIIVFGSSQPNLGSLQKGENYNIGQNTIINNEEYDFHNHSSRPILAENNSWGTSNMDQINSQIYDASDESKYGEVDFQPVLGSQRNAVSRILGNLYASGDVAGNTGSSSETSASTEQQIEQSRTEPIAEVKNTNEQNKSAVEEQITKTNTRQEVPDPVREQPDRNTRTNIDTQTTDLIASNTTDQTSKENEESSTSQKPDDNATLLASNDEKAPETNKVEEIKKPEIQEPVQPEINYDQIFFDGFLDEKKEIVKQVAPVISDMRHRPDKHGQVYVRVVVDKSGKVETAHAIRGINEYYDKISEEAAKKFEFKPGRINGRIVKFQTMLLFKF